MLTEISLTVSTESILVIRRVVVLPLPEVDFQDLTGYEAMEVVVKAVPSRRKTNLTRDDIDNTTTYITAEFPALDIPGLFIVGDNQEYGAYINKPLEDGSYQFYVGLRAKTEIEVLSYTLIATSTIGL